MIGADDNGGVSVDVDDSALTNANALDLDYADQLAAFFREAVRADVDLPPVLLDQFLSYLYGLTQEVMPPPAELLETAVEFLATEAIDERYRDDFDKVAKHLFDSVFPRLTLLDFTPLDPDGVDGAVQKLTIGRDVRGTLEKLALLLKGLQKLKDLQMPAGTKWVWTRHGPFELLAIAEAVVPISRKFSQLIRLTDDNKIRSIAVVQVRRYVDVPPRTDVMTADLIGASFFANRQPLKVTLSSSEMTVPVVSSREWELGPITCQLSSFYNPLKDGRTGYVSVVVSTPYVTHVDLDDFYLNAVIRMNIRHYSLIVT